MNRALVFFVVAAIPGLQSAEEPDESMLPLSILSEGREFPRLYVETTTDNKLGTPLAIEQLSLGTPNDLLKKWQLHARDRLKPETRFWMMGDFNSLSVRYTWHTAMIESGLDEREVHEGILATESTVSWLLLGALSDADLAAVVSKANLQFDPPHGNQFVRFKAVPQAQTQVMEMAKRARTVRTLIWPIKIDVSDRDYSADDKAFVWKDRWIGLSNSDRGNTGSFVADAGGTPQAILRAPIPLKTAAKIFGDGDSAQLVAEVTVAVRGIAKFQATLKLWFEVTRTVVSHPPTSWRYELTSEDYWPDPAFKSLIPPTLLPGTAPIP